MTRAKSKPPLRKPFFDEAGILGFAAGETNHADNAEGTSPDPTENRLSLTLILKSEVVSRLKAEADRKNKTIDQVVDKLVTKHLGKH